MKLIAILCFCFTICKSQIISQYPTENIVIFINENFTISVLVNTSETPVVTWLADSEDITTLPDFNGHIELNQSNANYSLTLYHHAVINHLTIGCRVHYNDTVYHCHPVYVQEQDILNGNVGLIMKHGDTFSWIKPYTLDVTYHEIDVWYAFINVDLTTGRYVCCNLIYYYTNVTCYNPDFNPNHVYYFEVIAMNPVGYSDSSVSFTTYGNDADPTIGEYYNIFVLRLDGSKERLDDIKQCYYNESIRIPGSTDPPILQFEVLTNATVYSSKLITSTISTTVPLSTKLINSTISTTVPLSTKLINSTMNAQVSNSKNLGLGLGLGFGISIIIVISIIVIVSILIYKKFHNKPEILLEEITPNTSDVHINIPQDSSQL